MDLAADLRVPEDITEEIRVGETGGDTGVTSQPTWRYRRGEAEIPERILEEIPEAIPRRYQSRNRSDLAVLTHRTWQPTCIRAIGGWPIIWGMPRGG